MKLRILIAVIIVAAILIPCFAAYEDQITITTYYPAPAGSYNELATNKLAVNVTGTGTLAEYSAMQNGDVHVGRSLILGAGGSGFSYNEIAAANRPKDGDLLVKGNIGLGVANSTLTASNAATSGNLNVNDIYIRNSQGASNWVSYGLVHTPSTTIDGASFGTCTRAVNMQFCWGRQFIVAASGLNMITIFFPQSFNVATGYTPVVTATYRGNSSAYVRCVESTTATSTQVYYYSDVAGSPYYIDWTAMGYWQ